MSAAPVQSNVPSDIRQDAQPYYIQERDAIIPRFYQASLHEGKYDAKVTYDGMPIVIGGETLTIGLVPPERRWAIGEVEDGWAKCIDQRTFDELCLLWKQQEVSFKSQGKEVLDFPHLEPRPNVRDFVSWKVHKTDPTRLIRLGMPHERQVVRQGTHVYDPETDAQMTREEWAAREKAKMAKPSADAERIAALEAMVERLTGGALMAAPSGPAPAVKVVNKETAPCGKEVQRLDAHMRFCKKPGCRPPKPEDVA